MFCFFSSSSHFSSFLISIILFLKGRKSQFWFCLFLNVKFCLLSSGVFHILDIIVYIFQFMIKVMVIIICFHFIWNGTPVFFSFLKIFLTSQCQIDACFGGRWSLRISSPSLLPPPLPLPTPVFLSFVFFSSNTALPARKLTNNKIFVWRSLFVFHFSKMFCENHRVVVVFVLVL